MTKPTHINFGFLVLLFLILYNPVFSIFMLLFPFLSILSDWDLSQAFLAKKFGISIIGRHRGWTHSFVFPTFIALVVYVVNYIGNTYGYWQYSFSNWDYVVLFFGVFSHVFGDFFTVSGVKWFWPIPFLGKISLKSPLWQAKTKSKSEYTVSTIVLIINIFLAYLLIQNAYLLSVTSGFIDFIKEHQTIAYYIIGVIILFNFYLFSKEIFQLSKNGKKIIKIILDLVKKFFIVGILSIVIILLVFYFKEEFFVYSLMVIPMSILYILYTFYSNIEKIINLIIFILIGFLYIGLAVYVSYLSLI